MKIHFHTDSPICGGSENMMMSLLNSKIMGQEHQSSLSYRFSHAYETGLKRKLKVPIQIYQMRMLEPMRIGNNSKTTRNLAVKILLSLFRKIVFYPIFLFQSSSLVMLLWRIKPDILHINGGGYPAALSTRAAVVAGRICRIKNILYFSNNIAVPYNSLQRYFEFPIDLIVRHSVDLFVTGSLCARSALIRVLRMDESKFKTINNGVEPNWSILESSNQTQSNPDNSKVVVGIIAILEPRKGHIDLLESVRLLKIEKKITSENFSLLVAGEGWFRTLIQEEIKKNEISELVTLVGEVEDVYSFITKLDLLVLPSTHQEDLPHVILEAMAFSKPIIGTSVGGIPEQVVNGLTGFIVPPNKPIELAKCLSDLIQDPAMRLQMGKNGQKRFLDHFTAQLAIERYLFEYALLQEPKDVVS